MSETSQTEIKPTPPSANPNDGPIIWRTTSAAAAQLMAPDWYYAHLGLLVAFVKDVFGPAAT